MLAVMYRRYLNQIVVPLIPQRLSEIRVKPQHSGAARSILPSLRRYQELHLKRRYMSRRLRWQEERCGHYKPSTCGAPVCLWDFLLLRMQWQISIPLRTGPGSHVDGTGYNNCCSATTLTRQAIGSMTPPDITILRRSCIVSLHVLHIKM
jgi:hypothetical protein